MFRFVREPNRNRNRNNREGPEPRAPYGPVSSTTRSASERLDGSSTVLVPRSRFRCARAAPKSSACDRKNFSKETRFVVNDKHVPSRRPIKTYPPEVTFQRRRVVFFFFHGPFRLFGRRNGSRRELPRKSDIRTISVSQKLSRLAPRPRSGGRGRINCPRVARERIFIGILKSRTIIIVTVQQQNTRTVMTTMTVRNKLFRSRIR